MTLHPFVATETQTCFACPDQWEGELLDGRHFYFRYRGGYASLGVGTSADTATPCRASSASPPSAPLSSVSF